VHELPRGLANFVVTGGAEGQDARYRQYANNIK
jgi:hypothetical protein